MKNRISEVVLPLNDKWFVEAYAWSKELARRLHIPFRVIVSGESQAQTKISPLKFLEGDGYFISHYKQAPAKTQATYLGGDFDGALQNFMSNRPLAIVVGQEWGDRPSAAHLVLKNHIVISVPSEIQKADESPEFTSILRQIAILNIPFELFPGEGLSFISKLRQSIRAVV